MSNFNEEALDLLDYAWGIIANAGWDASTGNVDEPKTEGWYDAATRWREQYFKFTDDYGVISKPELEKTKSPALMSLAEIDPRLVKLLKEAGDNYGPMGVALVAARLTDIPALIRILSRIFEASD